MEYNTTLNSIVLRKAGRHTNTFPSLIVLSSWHILTPTQQCGLGPPSSVYHVIQANAIQQCGIFGCNSAVFPASSLDSISSASGSFHKGIHRIAHPSRSGSSRSPHHATSGISTSFCNARRELEEGQATAKKKKRSVVNNLCAV